MNDRAFYREVADRLRCDERRAESITFVVFQELRARLTPTEAANVAAQLPTGLKKMWLENERADREVERTHLPEFIGRVRQHAALPDDSEAERGIRAVFGVLQRLLGSPTGAEGEAWDIYSQLPKDMKRIWLDAAKPLER
jgi:uncharacterized protein (DUF2267 family)